MDHLFKFFLIDQAVELGHFSVEDKPDVIDTDPPLPDVASPPFTSIAPPSVPEPALTRTAPPIPELEPTDTLILQVLVQLTQPVILRFVRVLDHL